MLVGLETVGEALLEVEDDGLLEVIVAEDEVFWLFVGPDDAELLTEALDEFWLFVGPDDGIDLLVIDVEILPESELVSDTLPVADIKMLEEEFVAVIEVGAEVVEELENRAEVDSELEMDPVPEEVAKALVKVSVRFRQNSPSRNSKERNIFFF